MATIARTQSTMNQKLVQFGMALAGLMLMSLMGHMIYGLVTGLVFVWFARR